VRKAPSIVTLIDAAKIRQRGYRTLSDLLRDLPGIYLWKSPEGRDIASFRGIISDDNNKILLLIDGVPWYDGLYTHAFIDDYLPVSQIKQVEVIKGPGSAIYGTNAFSGVINIVTWDPADLDGARVRWLAGSTGRSSLEATAGAHSRVGGLDVGMVGYARWLDQVGDGLQLTPDNSHDINGTDPKRGVNVGARLQIAGLSVQVHHVDYRHVYLTDAANDPYSVLGKDPNDFGLSYHDTFFDARYTLHLGRNVSLVPYFDSQKHDDPGSYFYMQGITTTEPSPGQWSTIQHDTTVETRKDTRRWSAGIDAEIRPGIDHVLVGGIGTETVAIVDSRDGTPGVVDIAYPDGADTGAPTGFQGTGLLRDVFAYVQYTWTILPALEVTGGGRFDMRISANPDEDARADAFKPNLTPRLGVLLVPNERLTAKLLYGRAFRQANARELLVTTQETDSQGNFKFSSGNLDLRPEQIDTFEGEVTYEPVPALSLRLDGYSSWVHDEIDKVVPPNEYQNLPGTLRISGGEIGVKIAAGPVTADGTYALTLARYSADAGPRAGFPQYEFPPHMGKGSVRWATTEHLALVAFGEVYSYRPRIEWGRDVQRDDGHWFGLLHASVRAHSLGKDGRFAVTATVRNVLDTKYGTGVYRDQADLGTAGNPRYPGEIAGEGRSVTVGLEGKL